jgi:hypothetical protein
MSSDIILALGDDQLASQFQLAFPNGIPGGGDSDQIRLRMDQDFDPPEDAVETYEIKYKGMTILKTSMTHSMDKKFTVNVRVDQQWKVFDDLNAWWKMCYDPINGVALPDASVRTDIIVQAQDGQKVVKKNIRFKNCKIHSIKINPFDNASADPTRITLGFIFTDMID